MNTSGRSRRGPAFRSSLTRTCLMHGRDFRPRALILPLVSVMAVFTVAAHADEMKPASAQPPAPRAAPANPTVQARPVHPRGRTADARFAHGAVIARHYHGRHYRGRVAWEGGRWHRGVHDGRAGWWWDVGGVWYYYPQRMAGPPSYVSEDYADDIAYGAAPPPPVAYVPPPPPPPPPPNPAASAVGGAVIGGLLGGLLTGRAAGAAAGAVVGGATGAITGAAAASRPGYYRAQGNCYYRYPSGQYVPADPRWCY